MDAFMDAVAPDWKLSRTLMVRLEMFSVICRWEWHS